MTIAELNTNKRVVGWADVPISVRYGERLKASHLQHIPPTMIARQSAKNDTHINASLCATPFNSLTSVPFKVFSLPSGNRALSA